MMGMAAAAETGVVREVALVRMARSVHAGLGIVIRKGHQ
jgi:hypothetical protein